MFPTPVWSSRTDEEALKDRKAWPAMQSWLILDSFLFQIKGEGTIRCRDTLPPPGMMMLKFRIYYPTLFSFTYL
ncbi:hypothetical protein M378DRAFT_533420 [Amanita muscaria Koide BX008]|uniref:Uncharacterized protein n=1 Tax=Amanita muscaria (strain Koide BX008) TaxID=946122 RepID=A0A0C2S0N5_AMAMK|nr:hypothetical protein M378DRAFT_533420 [Amanita muscaria Koide BX008]